MEMVFEQVLLRGRIGVVEEDALALYRYLEKKPISPCGARI